MNAQNNQQNSRKSSLTSLKTKNKPSKQTSIIIVRDQVTNENNQIPKKLPISNSANQRIELIRNLISMIQNYNIEPSVQSALIESLGNYSEILQKKFLTGYRTNKENQILQKNQASFNFQDSKLKNNDQSEHLSSSGAEEKNDMFKKFEKNTDTSNLLLQENFKSSQNKIQLPQINKEILKKPSQYSGIKKEVQIQEKQQQRSPFLSLPKSNNNSQSKTPKSRFYELKNSNNSVEMGNEIQQNQDLKNRSMNLLKIKPQTKLRIKNKEIVQGLKKRLGQHMILVGKLEAKIKEFQDKKLISCLQKVKGNNFQKSDSFNVNKLAASYEQAKQNTVERNIEIDILKNQLRQRQQELKNLWIALQRQNQKSLLSVIE